jgi:hypothetical protein
MTYIPDLPPYIPGHRWFMPLGSGHVYCRYSTRPAPRSAGPLRCLDLADIELPESERGHGLLTSLLEELEPVCGPSHGIQGLWLENVINQRLAAFLRRRPGYIQCVSNADPQAQAPCFVYQP